MNSVYMVKLPGQLQDAYLLSVQAFDQLLLLQQQLLQRLEMNSNNINEKGEATLKTLKFQNPTER